MGLPKPLQFLKDIVTEDIGPSGVGGAAKWVGERFQEPALGLTPKKAQWFLFGGKSPLEPQDPLLRQAHEARTRQEAQAVIDHFIGKESGDESLLNVMRDRGMLSRILTGKDDRAMGALSLDPYSEFGSNLMRVGGTRDFRGIDPYYLQDTLLQKTFEKNNRLALVYLRETDPLSAMPGIEGSLGETIDQNHNGIKDIWGRIVGGAKATFLGPFGMFNRTEEVLGNMYFNQVKDPYLRYQAAKHLYQIRGKSMLDWSNSYQNNFISELENIQAAGAIGSEASGRMEAWLKNSPYGIGGSVYDLVAKTAIDPLWLLPVGKIVTSGREGLEAATGAKRFGVLTRLVSPSGRAVKSEGGFTLKQLLSMDEAAYAAKKWASPAKGPIRTLFELDPWSAGREAGRQILVHTAPVQHALTDNPDHISDLFKSIRTGKDVGFVAREMPGFMEVPAMANLHGIVQSGGGKYEMRVVKALKETTKVGEEEVSVLDHLNKLVAKGGDDAVQAAAEKHFFIRHAIENSADEVVREAYHKLYQANPLGRFLTRRWMPVVGAIRPWVVVTTINNVGFIWLNVVSNYARMIWSSARHPLEATNLYAKSMAYEFGHRGVSDMNYLGKPLLDAIGFTPLDVELGVSRNTGFRELVLHKKTVEEAVELTGLQKAQAILKQSKQPLRDLLDKFRWRDLLFAPVNAAAMVDRVTRRTVFIQSLREQLGWGHGASWIRKTGIFPIADHLEKAGVPKEAAQLYEDMFRSEVRAYASGAKAIPAGGQINEQLFTQIGDKVATAMREGLDVVGYSLDDVSRRYFLEKGYSAEQADVMVQDLIPFMDNLHTEVLSEKLPQLIRKEITPKQFRDMVDARVLDYYDIHDILSQMGRVPSFWRPESTYQDYLRLTEQAMRQDMEDTAAHVYRFFDQVVRLDAPRGDITKFHTLVGDLTARNAEDLRAINEAVRAAAREGKGLEGLAQPAAEALPTGENILYHGTSKEFAEFARPEHVASIESLVGPGVYLTDAPEVAREYAAKGKGFVSAVEVPSNLKLLDLDQPLTTEVVAVLRKRLEAVEALAAKVPTEAHGIEAGAWNALLSAHDAGGNGWAAWRDFGRAFEGAPHFTAADAILEGPNTALQGMGYGGMKYAEKAPSGTRHNATVLFGAKDAKITKTIPAASVGQLPPDLFKTWEGMDNAARAEVLQKAGRGKDFATSAWNTIPTPVQKDLEKVLSVQGQASDFAQLWEDYFTKKLDRFNALYDWTAEQAAKRGEAYVTKILQPWKKSWLETYNEHRDLITEALSKNTDEAWGAAGSKISKLYEEHAALRGEVFGHGANDLPSAAQTFDASGPLAATVDDFSQFFMRDIQKNMPQLRKGGLYFGAESAAQAVMRSVSKDAYGQWRRAASQMLSNAMVKTDFAMLNYNNQYGLDRIFQMFIPFLFWPSRDSVNWAIRAARQPGAFAGLIAAVQEPQEYARMYGLPQRTEFQIPVPMPFMDDFLHDTPIIKNLLADVNFGPVYWIDPIRFVFPFSQFRQNFEDDKRRSTPMGLVADWMQNYTPFSMNPFMKILGTETGFMDADSFASVQFNGGPLGIPLTPTAQLAARWLYGGDLDAIPESEMYTYTDKGHFSIPFLGKVLGLEPDRFDIYRAERSLWALAATDSLLPGKSHEEQVQAAWDALDTHKGVAWSRALRSSEDESLLRQLTQYIGFPFGGVTGMNEGEWMWLNLRQAYSYAAENGELDKFFEKYPEFEVRSAVVKGLSDPKAKQQAIDTELYYQDVEKLIKQPYAQQINQLNDTLDQLGNLSGGEGAASLTFLQAGKATHPDEQQVQDEYDTMLTAVESGTGINAAIKLAESHLRAHQNALRPEEQGGIHDPYPGEPEKNQAAVDGFTQVIDFLKGKRAGVEPTNAQSLREQRQLLLDTMSKIRDEQSKIYDILDKAYPNRKDELSLYTPPRERALKMARNEWEKIIQEPGESYEEYQQRQEDFLSQFPPEEAGWSANDWEDSYTRQLNTMVEYSAKMRKATAEYNWDAYDTLPDWRDAKLAAIHDEAMNGNLSRKAVESYLASWFYPKSPEQLEFDQAKQMFSLWMGLVSGGSPFTSKEKAAISDYFKAQPLIQKHYPLEVIPLENITMQGRLDFIRRDEIWSTYYGMQSSEMKLDYMRTVQEELNTINRRLGLSPLVLIDYETPPPEMSAGDPLRARMEMYLTTARERALQNQSDQPLDEETLQTYDKMLSMDSQDPSSLSTQGLEWYLRGFSEPDQTQ